jgi:hypothetical protein
MRQELGRDRADRAGERAKEDKRRAPSGTRKHQPHLSPSTVSSRLQGRGLGAPET